MNSQPQPAGLELAFRQFLQVYVWPEVEKRQGTGELSGPFRLWAAQALFYPDGRRNVVRLNQEVQLLIKASVAPGHAVEAGQLVRLDDIADIEQVQLADDDDPDAGHITALALPSGRLFTFDARYNKALSRQHLKAASEFLTAAQLARNAGHWHSCVDCLFSAAELAARAALLSIPDKQFRQQSKHHELKKRFRQWTQMGNATPEQYEAFNNLSAWRRAARYLSGPLRVDPDVIDRLLGIVASMIEAQGALISIGVDAAC